MSFGGAIPCGGSGGAGAGAAPTWELLTSANNSTFSDTDTLLSANSIDGSGNISFTRVGTTNTDTVGYAEDPAYYSFELGEGTSGNFLADWDPDTEDLHFACQIVTNTSVVNSRNGCAIAFVDEAASATVGIGGLGVGFTWNTSSLQIYEQQDFTFVKNANATGVEWLMLRVSLTNPSGGDGALQQSNPMTIWYDTTPEQFLIGIGNDVDPVVKANAKYLLVQCNSSVASGVDHNSVFVLNVYGKRVPRGSDVPA